MSRKAFILFFLFILSRIIFINPFPIFFDSPEYLARFSNPNLLQAIASGHMPLHIGYIITYWPFFQVAKLINISPSYFIILIQILFSSLAIYCFYSVILQLINKKTALISTAIVSLTPLYWITNVTIMAEATYINFFIISLFFFLKYTKNKAISLLFIGATLFNFAFLTNPLVFLWSPLIFFVGFHKRQSRSIFIALSISIIVAMLINGYFVGKLYNASFIEGLNQYIFKEDIKIAPKVYSPIMIFRFIRNVFVPTLQNNTSILLLLGTISLITLYKKSKRLFLMGILWIVPSLLTFQWFDSLLFGRHGVIATFGFAYLSAVILEKRKKLFIFTIIFLSLISIPTLSLLKQPIPYIEAGEAIKNLPKGLLVDTHFSRPQTENKYKGEITYVNQPGWNIEALINNINSHLELNKNVFITSQAMSDPYGVYSGPYLYPISLSYIRKSEIIDILSSFKLEKYSKIGDVDIEIFKIISKEESSVPKIEKLKYSSDRIGYFDPINQLWFLIERANIIQIQNIIKG